MNEKKIISYIKKYYPTNSTALIAKKLKTTTSRVRTIAKNNNIVKCEKYKSQLKKQLVVNRRKWYEASIPEFSPTYFQEQLILGSLLGDGYISKGAQRSINYYYQEHFGDSQKEYRQWKLAKLKNLNFSINGNYLSSKSHPYFTDMHQLLYPGGVKTLTADYLSKCNDPIFLSTLYLDDGSLTISYYYNKKNHTVYCHPCVTLYTLNFTGQENKLLAKHLNKTFNTKFVVSSHPDGHKTLLKINKEEEVRHLLKVIEPYVKEIPSMKYKTNITENIRLKMNKIKKKYGKGINIKISSSQRRRLYSSNEIDTLINFKKSGCTDEEIAVRLDRTYWSIVYKISELRKEGLL